MPALNKMLCPFRGNPKNVLLRSTEYRCCLSPDPCGVWTVECRIVIRYCSPTMDDGTDGDGHGGGGRP